VPTLLAATLPELQPHASAEDMYEAGLTPVSGITEALRCAAALVRDPGDPARLRAISAAAARRTPGDWLAEHAAKELLRVAGIAVPAGALAGDSDAAVAAAERLGGAVAIKLSAADLQHKVAQGAVALGVTGEAAVRAAYTSLRALPHWRHAAVLVEEMVEPGTELLVSVRRDTTVPVLVLGAGGSMTELIDDTVVVPLPLTAGLVEAGARRLRSASRFAGADGSVPQSLVDLVLAVAELAGDADLALLELNPVVVGADRAVAVDAVARRARSDDAG
jgi:acetyl-CoA synthetase